MKKNLNNNGWGLRTAILFTAIFIFCLLFSVVLINRWGLRGGDVIIDNDSNIENKAETTDNTEYYEELETNVYEAIQLYINDNPKLLETKGNITITVKKLLNQGYLSSLEDGNGNSCSGYVDVYNNIAINYNAYIKCPGYTTNGYEGRKDD